MMPASTISPSTPSSTASCSTTLCGAMRARSCGVVPAERAKLPRPEPAKGWRLNASMPFERIELRFEVMFESDVCKILWRVVGTASEASSTSAASPAKPATARPRQTTPASTTSPTSSASRLDCE